MGSGGKDGFCDGQVIGQTTFWSELSKNESGNKILATLSMGISNQCNIAELGSELFLSFGSLGTEYIHILQSTEYIQGSQQLGFNPNYYDLGNSKK